MDIFRATVWNSHRIRSQRDAELPKGIPNHVYSFPEAYGADKCGTALKYIYVDILHTFD